MRVWEARAHELERRLADLGALARVVDEPNLRFVTARVIADAVGPFARSVLINGGRDHGIKPGYPVISSDGFVGRVLEAGARASRVLLITDINSRIPVLVGAHGIRGILVGTNGSEARLEHMPERARIATGDEVVTSGTGGLLPGGLRLGSVSAADRREVRPHGKLDALQHVSVLFYDAPSTELAAETPQRHPAPGAVDKPARH
jgi:rod shape-determining protein MreC